MITLRRGYSEFFGLIPAVFLLGEVGVGLTPYSPSLSKSFMVRRLDDDRSRSFLSGDLPPWVFSNSGKQLVVASPDLDCRWVVQLLQKAGCQTSTARLHGIGNFHLSTGTFG